MIVENLGITDSAVEAFQNESLGWPYEDYPQILHLVVVLETSHMQLNKTLTNAPKANSYDGEKQ